MGGPEVLMIDGSVATARVVEQEGGLRMRFDADEWARVRLHRGQRVPVRRGGRPEVVMVMVEAVQMELTVWVILADRVKEPVPPSRARYNQP